MKKTGLSLNRKKIFFLGLTLSSMFCSPSFAEYSANIQLGWGNDRVYHHGDYPRVYNHYRHGHYGSHGYYYNGPRVVIQVPPRRYYAPQCEEVEVCNSYGQCWLENYCN